MSAAPGKVESSQPGQSGSRTSTPMDASNDDNNQTQNTGDKKEDPQDNASESKDKQTGDLETSGRVGQTSEGGTGGDYFNHFSLEPNPFEQSFGNPPAETPGKSVLPPVASLTSPALPGATSAGLNWSNSLRAGPLSPAMLAGPAGPSDYFDNVGRGFPTPNESSLRTGLTPGGGGSMFPAPTPSGQAGFPNLQSGGATPSTLDFQRTALNAAKKNGGGPTSNPQEAPEQLLQQGNIEVTKSGSQMDPFSHHDATDAANGLFMLSKGAQAASGGQFPAPTSQPMPTNLRQEVPKAESPLNDPARMGAMSNGQSQEMPVDANLSDGTGEAQATKSNSRGNRKKSNAKGGNSTNTRRKAEDTSKGPNKKLKSGNGAAAGDKSDSDSQGAEPARDASGNKKLTDEEKRKNFLERNRVAALKCRQRKKQWLTNLQNKVEMYTADNERLNGLVSELRREVVTLKSMLLAHKDCPVTQAQGLNGMGSNGMPQEYPAIPSNPYGMTMQQPTTIPAQGMPRQ